VVQRPRSSNRPTPRWTAAVNAGQAIYLFDKEKTAKPECYGDCAEAWPPVLTDGEPVATSYARLVQLDPPREVSALAAAEMVRSGALLVDVREDDEWAAGHAPAAAHLPMSRLFGGRVALPSDRLIVCVCHVGARSAAVAAGLVAAGWDAVNLVGGMEAWLSAGLPVVGDDGRPGTVI